jgi:hypothetical protein
MGSPLSLRGSAWGRGEAIEDPAADEVRQLRALGPSARSVSDSPFRFESRVP